MDAHRPQQPVVTAADARARLARLATLQVAVARAARAEDAEPVARLGEDVAACRDAFVGLAVGEIASFRAQLSGPQVG
jgi:hypothetical protein